MSGFFASKILGVGLLCLSAIGAGAALASEREAPQRPQYSVSVDLMTPGGRVLTFLIEEGHSVVFYDSTTEALVRLAIYDLDINRSSAILAISELEEVVVNLGGQRRMAYRPLPGGEEIFAMLGEVLKLPTAGYFQARLTAISQAPPERRADRAAVGRFSRKHQDLFQDLIFLDSMCCVTCGGIGGCGSSVSGSCGNCSS